MPALVRLYIRNVLIGLVLAIVFVAALLWFNVANLWHLVSASPEGWLAVVMLVIANWIVFAGVQFAIVVMLMGEKDEDPGAGSAVRVDLSRPVRAEATAGQPERR